MCCIEELMHSALDCCDLQCRQSPITAVSYLQVLMAAQSALDELMSVMPPLRCVDILAHKLPSEAATICGTAVDGEVLCATIRCLQVSCLSMGQYIDHRAFEYGLPQTQTGLYCRLIAQNGLAMCRC